MTFTLQTIRRYPWLAAAMLPAAWAAFLLLERAWFEAQGTLHDDVHTYLAVGRGILNELVPYRDLFESKPPGIFLLSAFSLKIFGGAQFLKALNVITVLVIPACGSILAWMEVREAAEPRRTLSVLAVFVLSALLDLYASAVAGEGLVEPLGAALCMIFAALYRGMKDQPTSIQKGILAIVIVSAVGLKEPFILVLGAIALLLARSKTHVTHGFLIPLALAVVIGTIALLLLGYLGPYVTIYLKHMFGYHLGQLDEMNGPLIMRSLMAHRMLSSVWDFSHPLAIAVTTMILGSIISAFSSKQWLRLCTTLVAVYLLFLAVGAGGDFYVHHFVFAIPGLIVLGVLLFKDSGSIPQNMIVRSIGLIVALFLLAALIWHKDLDYPSKIQWWNERSTELRRAAAAIDLVMDRCDFSRYLTITNKGAGPFGFTRHSPEGPIFIQFSRFVNSNPMYLEAFRKSLETTPIIVLNMEEPTNLTDTAKAYVNENFSKIPPSCAALFEQPEPYLLLFRT